MTGISRLRGLADRPAPLHRTDGGGPAAWTVSQGLVPYPEAVSRMEDEVRSIGAGGRERVWLLEHPPLYTAGTSARPEDLLEAARLPVFASGRGGQYTYHGPGQRVAYVMLDLAHRAPDIRRYVAALETWLINTLGAFGIRGERRPDRVGVWVAPPDAPAEAKIAAIGIRVRRWISFHGVSLNVDPDLANYLGIVACGAAGYGVTSLAALGVSTTMEEVDDVLKREFATLFGPVG